MIKEGIEEELWEKAVSFVYTTRGKTYWYADILHIFYLLLSEYNKNPNGLLVILENSNYNCAEGGARRYVENKYLLVPIGNNLTSKELVYEELMRRLSLPGADVEKGKIYSPSSLKNTSIEGVYNFTPYLGSVD